MANPHSPRHETTPRPPLWKVWVTAARPHTLTASLCPCLVAVAITTTLLPSRVTDPSTLVPTWALWLYFCVSVQIGTNLHNDYSDYVQGADDVKTRVGQARATAMGWLTPYQTCVAATLTLSSTFMTGVVIIATTHQWSNGFAWFIVVSSVFNAFAYTSGPYPLGYIGLGHWSIAYAGLGDVFVFLYFGLVATWMLPYLVHCQDPQRWSAAPDNALPSVVTYGLQVGLLATNIIVVNNLRDRHTDVAARKRTTAVRFGRTFSTMQYQGCNLLAYALVLVDSYHARAPFALVRLTRLAPLLSLPLALRETRAILGKEGSALNPHVGGAALVQVAFCLLLSTSLLLFG